MEWVHTETEFLLQLSMKGLNEEDERQGKSHAGITDDQT